MELSWRKILVALIVCLLCAMCLATVFSQKLISMENTQKIAEPPRPNVQEEWKVKEISVPVWYEWIQAYRLTDPDGNDYVLIMTSDGPTITSIPKSEGGK